MISNKVSFGRKDFKCFIGCKDNDQVIPMCIMLTKIRGNVKSFDETKYMSFLIKDDKLLKIYNEIWNIFCNNIKKRFDSEPVIKKKNLKATVRPYEGKINTKFHDNGMPKESFHCICLSLIFVDSVFKMGINCYPQVF